MKAHRRLETFSASPAPNSNLSESRKVVFISHSNPEDNDFTTWLAARLALAGYEVWSDLTQLIGGEVFWKDIEEAIRQYSIRFLSVLSSTAPKKRGFMKELSVADAIEGSGQFGDFIIPLRIDDIPFSDIPIQIHNKNVIDFIGGWHIGLARVIKKLEQDNVPKTVSNLAQSLGEWATSHLDLQRGVCIEDEVVMSNWLTITDIPSTLRISSFTLTPLNIDSLQAQWPARLIGSRVVSFARSQDFDLAGEFANLRNESELETDVFLRSGSSSLPQLNYNDRANVLTDLLRQAWSSHARQLGLLPFKLASGNECWFNSAPAGKADRIAYTDALGNRQTRSLRKKREARCTLAFRP
jgi:hypothetical protein